MGAPGVPACGASSIMKGNAAAQGLSGSSVGAGPGTGEGRRTGGVCCIVSGVPAAVGAASSAVQGIIDREYQQTLAADGHPRRADRGAAAGPGRPDHPGLAQGLAPGARTPTCPTRWWPIPCMGGPARRLSCAAPTVAAPPAAVPCRLRPPTGSAAPQGPRCRQRADAADRGERLPRGRRGAQGCRMTRRAHAGAADARSCSSAAVPGSRQSSGFHQCTWPTRSPSATAKGGFIVATAFLPAQTVGDATSCASRCWKGRSANHRQGTRRYHLGVIAAPAEKLRGKALQKGDVDTALLYDRDLPGVSVTSTFQPGEQTGATDLIYGGARGAAAGQSTTRCEQLRHRAHLLLSLRWTTWNSPLGIGDSLAANVNYARHPSQSRIAWSLLTARGLSAVAEPPSGEGISIPASSPSSR